MSDFRRRLMIASFNSIPSKPTGYIKFEDPEVERICIHNFSSDGIGVTYEDAEKVKYLSTWFASNHNIKSFNELIFFTSIDVIGRYAFKNCTQLKYISLPEQIQSIEDSAFDNSGISSIVIHRNCLEILNAAFRGSKIQFADIGENVNILVGAVFSNCSFLKNIIFRNITPVPNISPYLFNNAPIANIYVPDESVEAYKTAPNWSAFADKIKPLSTYVEPTNE